MERSAVEAAVDAWAKTLERANRLWVAYSGGLDSTLLLHAVRRSLPDQVLGAVHVNHGIHVEADRWAAFCQQQAAALGVQWREFSINVEPGSALEERARNGRYQVFEQLLEQGDVLLMAHHANDQAETLLFRLVRGSGLEGLSGMPAQRQLGQGMLVRPFLSLQRTELEQQARLWELDWIEDSANREARHARNFLRHQIVPLLETRWPHAVRQMARASAHLEESSQLLARYAADLLVGCHLRTVPMGQSIGAESFARLADDQQRLVLRHWLARAGLSIESAGLGELQRQVQNSGRDSRLSYRLGSHEFTRYQDQLYLIRPGRSPLATDEWQWAGTEPLVMADWGELQPLPVKGAATVPYRVRLRREGERYKLGPEPHTRSLKQCFQERGIAPWLRERTPLICHGDRLIAAADLFSGEEGFPVPRMFWREGF